MAKKVTGIIRLQIPAGAANPAPPIGAALVCRGGASRRLLDQNRGRGRFADEGERTILIDRDHHGNNHSALRLSGGIELFTERHDVAAGSAEGGADRRSGVSRTSRDLQADHACNLLCHS